VEGDASSASYFIAAGAIAGRLTVQGSGNHSIQGDVRFAEAVAMMGGQLVMVTIIFAHKSQKIKAIDLDCNHIPDAAMTLAVMALFAKALTSHDYVAKYRQLARKRNRPHCRHGDRITQSGCDS
jgi:3-phosphoshikimate 1-carboxyvinyltransferase